jgi:hypothetical protein
MPKVLTAQAQVTCVHQGTVQVAASQQQLKAAGGPVLVMGDMEGKPIIGCTLTASASTTPCSAVVATVAGASAKLSVGSTPVLLDTAKGVTNSVPPGTWQVRSPGQTELDTS